MVVPTALSGGTRTVCFLLEHSFWEIAGEGGGHSTGSKSGAIIPSAKKNVKVRRKPIFSFLSPVFLRNKH